MTDEIIDKTTGGAPAGAETFDLRLFLELNEQYKNRPVVPAPRKSDDDSRTALARQRAALLEERVGIRGCRVLEVGCGAGDMSAIMAGEYECEVVGVDIREYSTWRQHGHPKLSLEVLNISQDYTPLEGKFDRIVSLVVWEHVQHPFSALRACRELLAPNGLFYLRANLYRSAVGSHRYREVFFPWPHLLFPNSVFEEFYEHIGQKRARPAWVNKLTYAQYLYYFEALGFIVQREWPCHRPLDEELYKRFEDELSRYPVFDLTHDYFDVILRLDPDFDTKLLKDIDASKLSTAALLRRRTSNAHTTAEEFIGQLARTLLQDAREGMTLGQMTAQLKALFGSRSYRIAKLLAHRPRDWKYWLRLPGNVLKIAAAGAH